MASVVEAPVRPPEAHEDEETGSCRICMVVHSLYPQDGRVRREAEAAVEAGHAVDIICMRGPGQVKVELFGDIRVKRLPVGHVPGAGLRRIVIEYLTFAALVTLTLVPPALRRRYDLVHIHNPPDFLIVAGLLPRRFGSRLALDVHDLSSHMFRARFPGRMGRMVARLLDLVELWASRIAHVILTVHEPYRQELITHGVEPEKVVVVMNVLNPGELRQVRHQAPSGSGRATTFTAMYAGTIAPWYGVELIVDAMALLGRERPETRAVILGGGDALDAVRARAEAKGVASRIELSGQWLRSEEILLRLGQASCGLIPNLPIELNRFALSTKLFEYIELGLPAVVARLETLAAHFSDDEVTFFEPGNAMSLAAALQWVEAHPEVAALKAQRARERVAREYSWDTNRTRYLAAIAGEPVPARVRTSQ